MANAYINLYQELSPSDLLYINTKKQLQADTITVPNTAQFTSASILEPSLTILGTTTKLSFEYYINGQNVSPLLVDSLTIGGGNVIFTFNTSQLGYSLETDDEIIVIGKFA
jgi:hypothetical protein